MPISHVEDLYPIAFIRTMAVARVLMPASHVRLTAGREQMQKMRLDTLVTNAAAS